MTDWSDPVNADPLADLQAWQKKVAEGCGLRPTTIHASQRVVDMYEWSLRRDEMLRDLLMRTTRKNFVRRYVLRRMLGQSRLRIVAPRSDRLMYRARLRWNDWKHRNDLYWGY